MAALHSLVFTKKIGGAVFDSATHGIVCLEDMPLMSFEAKEIAENDWPDEHGLDVYDSSEASVKYKPQDITFVMGVKGTGYLIQYAEFLDYLTKGGIQFSVSSSYTGMTLPSARFIKAEPSEFISNESEKIMVFKLTLRVTGY